MIGLFMVLPVFTAYAQHLSGSTPMLIGMAVGIYGLSQALFQIPFGMMSDKFGRKPLIFIGLMIFITGSLIAGFADSINVMIIGRALQGVGAVGSTILAMVADLTREEQRTKAMAITGITIGLSFSLAMLIGPLLSKWLAVNHLFYIAGLCGSLAIIILYSLVPTPASKKWHRDAEPDLRSFLALFFNAELARLNFGIFILHAIFTASFVVIPISLLRIGHLPTNQQWLIYAPSLAFAFLLVMIAMGIAERKQQLKPYFLGGIAMLALSELIIWLAPSQIMLTSIGLCLFFTGFSLLEAFLPSLISRIAPISRKGSALGIFSCAQFLGIFIGGVLGGWLFGQFSFSGVYLFCLLLSIFWFALSASMQPPRYLVTDVLRLSPTQVLQWEMIATKLHVIPGMVEVTLIAEDKVAYLKMERRTRQDPSLARLKEQIQSEVSF